MLTERTFLASFVALSLIGFSACSFAQESSAEKQLRRAAEILLDVHMQDGFLLVPPAILGGLSTDECKGLLQAQNELSLAERSSILRGKAFAEVRLLLLDAESARLDAFAEKDAAQRDTRLRAALAQRAVVEAKAKLVRSANAADDLPTALAQVAIEDVLCGGQERNEAKNKLEAFKNEALVRMLQSDSASVRRVMQQVDIAQLVQSEDAVRQKENQIKPTLPNAEAARRRSAEFVRTTDTAALLKSRNAVEVALKSAASRRQ